MTNRCAELNNESARLFLKSNGLRVSSKLDAQSSDLLKVYAAWNCTPCEKRFSSMVCSELYAELAIVSSAKMLVKMGVPLVGQLAPVDQLQFGEEYGRIPTKVNVCPVPGIVWPFGKSNPLTLPF